MKDLPTKAQLLDQCVGNIIFNKEVAKLQDNKINTRRIVTPKQMKYLKSAISVGEISPDITEHDDEHWGFAPYKVGRTYWGREPAKVTDHIINENSGAIYYQYSDSEDVNVINLPKKFRGSKWVLNHQGVPNGCIKEMARNFYKIKSVRLELLQEISWEDAKKEGVNKILDYNDVHPEIGMPSSDYITPFKTLWNSTAKAPYRWEDKPFYVWVTEYEKIEYEG